ncbi:LOW QUALITY PROTEIN: homeobox protein VENTX-like [Trachypithecus francoisi]|uniref:LOW QUALITY PROTEIN: homeobox protein VENTX-like n=1 Tax=Trachypithecus francoisi TaxID=54180 RepID=UPI00141AD695|nr:LOW QUALITY PROTEIN: homeobox protein VENTX-like [Trachypithecus francoisi]
MRLSSSPPRDAQQPSSFGSVDWFSQSSCSGPTYTSRPADVSPGASLARTRHSPLRQARSSNRPARERTVAAFTTGQVHALKGVFRHCLGPLEPKRLARKMQLSEVQIKTCLQNRRMKHKWQMQDSQLHNPFSGSLHAPPAFHSPSSGLANGLQPLCPWAPLPGPQALMLPPGSFWGLCQVEQETLASAWASCYGQPPAYHPLRPGSGVHTLGPALSRGPWGLCALLEKWGWGGCILRKRL